MKKSLVTVFACTSLFFAASGHAKEICLKGYGKTPAEAFQSGSEALKNMEDSEMGKGWMKDNMQIRILPNKEKDLFVAVVYSVTNPASCDLQLNVKTALANRPECKGPICPI
ncbi:MAG: hypothetical protein D3910_02430 [Candidatus Electrothrix sp. ATG2]|nr:hypothetical protein [Candidatus Electrothrix sp. ATG2]